MSWSDRGTISFAEIPNHSKPHPKYDKEEMSFPIYLTSSWNHRGEEIGIDPIPFTSQTNLFIEKVFLLYLPRPVYSWWGVH